MNLKIIEATPQDSNIIIELIKALYIELGEESESVGFLNAAIVYELLNNGKTEIYLVLDETENIIGIQTLTECQSLYAGGTYGIIDELYVLPDFREHGIGSLMLSFIKEIGKERKWNRIELTGPTEERWKRTIDFYERSGFVFTGPKMKYLL
ncbi:MAG TPA: GNAT family N-acetyltransferase [Saprospiraceae bacterium]|nr:GNAT family N-acetyltransferase [Saprospiraceae bacterium]